MTFDPKRSYTTGGYPFRFIGFTSNGRIIGERICPNQTEVLSWDKDGYYWTNGMASDLDLVPNSIKHVGYLCLYKHIYDGDVTWFTYDDQVMSTEKEANEQALASTLPTVTVKIEWTEHV